MELTLHCFGASTPCGEALRNLTRTNFVGYSRNPSGVSSWLHHADLNDPADFHPAAQLPSLAVWISFSPIWLFASFLDRLATYHPERLQGLRGVIACSSSSTITKRFAANRFDRQLVDRLITAENKVLMTCRGLSVPCRVLRPTMIYGKIGVNEDNNLSLILQQMRRFPFLPLPADSGLRQPIHASQLASVAFRLAHQLDHSLWKPSLPELISLGGDTTLTYREMIIALQQCQSFGDPARHCKILSIPNRLFFLLAAPLLLRSPKAFEAVLRMGANLSGFTPCHQFLGSEPQRFPVLPLA